VPPCNFLLQFQRTSSLGCCDSTARVVTTRPFDSINCLWESRLGTNAAGNKAIDRFGDLSFPFFFLVGILYCVYHMSNSRRGESRPTTPIMTGTSNDPSVAAATAAAAAAPLAVAVGGEGRPAADINSRDNRRRKQSYAPELSAAAGSTAAGASGAAAASPALASTAKKKPRIDEGIQNSSRLALLHVLGSLCRFPDGSALVDSARQGNIASVDALCNLTDDQISALLLEEEEKDAAAEEEEAEVDRAGAVEDGSSEGAAGQRMRRQSEMMETLQLLKMWRGRMYLDRGGTYPTSDEWRRLSAADFRRFEGLARGPVGGGGVSNSAPPAGDGLVEVARQVARDFVKSIMGQKPEKIPQSDGMSVMRGVVMLERDNVALDVVIRTLTRPFWQACIDAVDPPRRGRALVSPNQQLRVCVVGTPGIGKTTCTPVLVKMLLERKKTVVYHVRSESGNRFVYEFIPGPDEGVVANVYPEQNWEWTIQSLMDPATYYVVDPGLFQGSCNPEANFRPKVIIVASPDSKHWGNGEFLKGRAGLNGVLKFFPVWELNEILHARAVLEPTMTIKKVEGRYSEVGGVPRHIFADDKLFEQALRRQEKAVKKLTAVQVKSFASGISALEAIVEDTLDASQPKSALIGYRLAADDNGQFSNYKVEVIATHAFARIVRRFMMNMWEDLSLPSTENPRLFEIYTRYLIASQSTTFKCRDGVGKRARRVKASCEIALGGGCTEVRLVGDIVDEAKKKKMVVFHSVDLNNELIDFLYQDSKGHFHAFQVTLAKIHSADVGGIVDLEAKVGGHRKLTLYYLVPDSKFDKFVTDPVDPRNPPSGVGAKCSIYHVSIPKPTPTAEERLLMEGASAS
jgi:hypothetical protein